MQATSFGGGTCSANESDSCGASGVVRRMLSIAVCTFARHVGALRMVVLGLGAFQACVVAFFVVTSASSALGALVAFEVAVCPAG